MTVRGWVSLADSGGVPVSRRRAEPRSRLLRALLRDLRSQGPQFVMLKTLDKLRRRQQESRYRFNSRRLVRRPESVKIDRPIFFLGVQGGGVTIIARCLYRHPRIVYASGNSDFWAGNDEIHNCRHVIRDVPAALVHRSYRFGNVDDSMRHHPRYGYQRDWLYATDEFLPRYRRSADDVDDAETARFRRVLQRLILAYAHDVDNARFVDMSQLYTIQVPCLVRMLQASTPFFVLAVRDPYATCMRAVRKVYRAESGSYIEHDRAAQIACAVEHWTNSYRVALESEGKVPLLIVRNESFLEDPERIVRGICDFAELDFHPTQLPAPGQRRPIGSLRDSKWHPLRRNENARYLDDIDPALVRALNKRAGDLIERFGYRRLDP